MTKSKSSPAFAVLTPSEIASLQRDKVATLDRLDEIAARKGLPPVKRATFPDSRDAAPKPAA